MLGETIIQITTEDGEKMLTFVGFGYYAETEIEKGKPYRFVDYRDFSVPLSVIPKDEANKYEDDKSEYITQYLVDCSLDEVDKYYEGIPRINEAQLTADIADGKYVLRRD